MDNRRGRSGLITTNIRCSERAAISNPDAVYADMANGWQIIVVYWKNVGSVSNITLQSALKCRSVQYYSDVFSPGILHYFSPI